MRMRVSTLIVMTAFLALPGMLFAQSSPAKAAPPAISVTLEYHEDNSGTFDVKDEKGVSVPSVQDGDVLKLGWTVLTGKGDVAELKMSATGTIIKMSGNTNFTLSQLRTATSGQDVFSLAVGKVRTVAGKASTKDQYQIRTTSAVCGVRGSDVVIEFQEGSTAKLSTLEGTGWIQQLAADGTPGAQLDVAQGLFADALASVFQAIQIPADVLAGLQNEMKFTKLDVNAALAQNEQHQAASAATGDQTSTTGTTTQAQATPTTPPAPKTNSFMDGIMAKLRDILGMQIGSLTIGNTTYSSVVIQPTFQLGQLKASLYLPIIYNGDMFNTADWYHPLGNDEWNFGGLLTGTPISTDPWVVTQDVLNDLLLKIRYLEWGQQRDPFFFKVGNLSDITIGHGLIMNNFANDADFPSVRRVGVNVGLDFGGFGLEAMVNDAANPDITGGRLYVRPVPGFKAALGVTGIVDLSPAKDWPTGAAAVGDPIFVNGGADIDLPFVESDIFSLVAFADAAAMLPYFRSAPTDSTYSGIYSDASKTGGFALSAILPDGISNLTNIKNWGAAAGFFGNLIFRDFTYRLEFRDFTGAFVPDFYNSGYERQRSQYLNTVLTYLLDPTNASYDAQTVGIYGEGGIVLSKLFSLNLSYFWPWAQTTNGDFTFGNDNFMATFTLEKGVIPIVNIWGTVSYERTNFINTILQSGLGTGLNLFDANTVVSATINYPVTDTLDVTLLYTTTAVRNTDGSVHYANTGDLLPQMQTSLAIETQIHL